MKRTLRLSIVVALLGIGAPASAQYDTEERDDDGSVSTLDDARASRSNITIRGNLRRRAIPETYTVRRGDTLWDVTGRYYGNPWEWPRVWSYNPEITNPHWIYPLDQVRLRPAGSAQAELPGSTGPVRQLAATGTVWLRGEGYLDREALQDSGVIIGSPEEQMLLSPQDDVYVRFDDGTHPEPGQSYTIFREMNPDERRGEEAGVLVRIFGAVRLRSYDADRNIGRAVITEALDPIERGYRVAPVPPSFDMVAPVPNDRDLEGEVVATIRPRQLSSDQQVIFVNVGEEQGVRLGNRIFIVREGDRWRQNLAAPRFEYGEVVERGTAPEPDQYPPEIIAEGRVVNVRPNTSAMLVTRTVEEVVVGDRVEMRRGF